MEAVAKPLGLRQRGSTWHYVVRVPTDLIEAARSDPKLWRRLVKRDARHGMLSQLVSKKNIIKDMVTVSLKTQDQKEAKSLVKLKTAEVEAVFQAARSSLFPDQGLRKSISKSEMKRLVGQWLQNEEQKHIVDGELPTAENRDEIVHEIEDGIAATQDYEDPDILQAIQRNAEKMLRSEGYSANLSAEEWGQFEGYVRRAYVGNLRRQLKWLTGEAADKLFDDGSTLGVSAPLMQSDVGEGITLAELIEKYLADTTRSRTPKTLARYETDFRIIKEIIGPDKPAREISRDDCRGVLGKVSCLPPHAKKKYPKKSIDEIIKIAEREELSLLMPKSVNSYMNSLASLFTFAVDEDIVGKHHARNLLMKDPVRAGDKRDPFTTKQLNTIFRAPVYTGCKNDGRGYAIPGPEVPRRGRFWVPLIALWTGMRLGECCQLHCNDIQDIDGVMCILIRENQEGDEDEADRKRIKTDAGHRYVPIHPELKKIGFLKFAQKRKQTGEVRLFSELTIAANGYMSENFSRWFRALSTKLGTKTDKTVFHSFRHNYREALSAAEVPLEGIWFLGGWTGKGGSDKGYGGGAKSHRIAKNLAKWIAKVKYPGLDLSHLYL